jgi:hypothetical protein
VVSGERDQTEKEVPHLASSVVALNSGLWVPVDIVRYPRGEPERGAFRNNTSWEQQCP